MEWQIVLLGELRILVLARCALIRPGLGAYSRFPGNGVIALAVLIPLCP